MLTNGLGLIDASALSPDHQVAADPGEANRIEVLRGPQTLAYGGSASPTQILSEAGIDIADPNFWRGGFNVIEGLMNELENGS